MTIEEKYFNEMLNAGIIDKDMALKFYKEKCEALQAELDKLKATEKKCACKHQEEKDTTNIKDEDDEVSPEDLAALLGMVKGLL